MWDALPQPLDSLLEGIQGRELTRKHKIQTAQGGGAAGWNWPSILRGLLLLSSAQDDMTRRLKIPLNRFKMSLRQPKEITQFDQKTLIIPARGHHTMFICNLWCGKPSAAPITFFKV